MTSLKLQRTSYRDERLTGNPIRNGSTTRAESERDIEEFLRPFEQIHAGSLHGWGIAEGLRVEAKLNDPDLVILPGVAVDSLGRHISLADGAQAQVGPPQSEDETDPDKFDTPSAPPKLAQVEAIKEKDIVVEATRVILPTAGKSGNKVLTIQFCETFDELAAKGLPAVFRYNHTPWLRLLDAATFKNDGKHVVLARVTLGEGADAGKVIGLTQDERRGVDLPVERILLHGPRATQSPLAVEQAVAAEIRARADGGLDVSTPPTSDDPTTWQPRLSIDGPSGKVGLGMSPSEKLTIHAPDKASTSIFFAEAGLATYGGLLRYDARNDLFQMLTKENGTEKLGISIARASGNVGIGIAQPQAGLHVHGGRLRVSESDGPAGSGVLALANGQRANYVFTDGASGHLYVRTDSAAHHVLLQTGTGGPQGNVGIGTDGPRAKLDVNGSLIVTGDLQVDGTASLQGNLTVAARKKATLGGDLQVDGAASLGGALSVAGNVGIGTPPPSPSEYKLQVNGKGYFSGDYLYVNAENAGRLRVGAAWGMPGLYSGDDGDKDLTLCVPRGRRVYLGWATQDAYVEGGTGQAYFKGKVGIGTTTPAARLSLGGALGQALLIHQNDGANVRAGFGADLTRPGGRELNIFFPGGGLGGHLSIGAVTEDGLYTYSEKIRVTEDGNVGIGTTSIHNPQGWNRVLDLLGTGNARLNVRSTGGVRTSVFSDENWDGARGVIGTESNHPLTFATNYTHRMTIDTAGNVGIGTTPNARLQVAGGAIMPAAGNSEQAGIMFPKDPGGGGSDAAWIRYYPRAGENTTFEIGTSNDPEDHIALMPSGGVGIGTGSPGAKLDVVGGGGINVDLIVNGRLRSNNNDGGLWVASDRFIGGHSTNQVGFFNNGWHLTVRRDGNVGIGKIDPADKLDVAGEVRILSNTNPIRFTSEWSGFPDGVLNQAEISNDTKVYKTLMIIGNKSAGVGRRVSVWDRLEVNGSMKVTGELRAGDVWTEHGYRTVNHDLAENYCSDQALHPGDVVCLAPGGDTIARSAAVNDVTVVGVISTKPGVLLNADGENPAAKVFPVALCGRIPCKVTDQNGTIGRGDLLTTSSTPGHAMKAQPITINGEALYRPGTIIGKALEPFESGTGAIEIFVALS